MNDYFCGLTYYICVSKKRYINDSDNGNSSATIVLLIVSYIICNFKIVYGGQNKLKGLNSSPSEGGESFMKNNLQRKRKE